MMLPAQALLSALVALTGCLTAHAQYQCSFDGHANSCGITIGVGSANTMSSTAEGGRHSQGLPWFQGRAHGGGASSGQRRLRLGKVIVGRRGRHCAVTATAKLTTTAPLGPTLSTDML
jgi:hypothetical protein